MIDLGSNYCFLDISSKIRVSLPNKANDSVSSQEIARHHDFTNRKHRTELEMAQMTEHFFCFRCVDALRLVNPKDGVRLPGER